MISSNLQIVSKELTSTISSKGQVTIPVAIRRHLKVSPKDTIAFIIDAQGGVKLASASYPDIASLRGAAGSLKESLDWKKMKEIAYEDRLKEPYEK